MNLLKVLIKWIFRGLTCLFVLLSIFFVLLALRSYSVADSLDVLHEGGFTRPGDHGDLYQQFAVVSALGHMRLEYWEHDDRGNAASEDPGVATPKPAIRWYFSSGTSLRFSGVERSEWRSTQVERAGVVEVEEFYRGAHAESELKYIIFPLWWLALTFGAVAGFSLVLWRRRRRTR